MNWKNLLARTVTAALTALALDHVAAAEIAVRGRVLTAEGAPLATAEVELWPNLDFGELARAQAANQPLPAAVARTRSDQDGGFLLSAPQAGLFKVGVRAAGRVAVETYLIPLVETRILPPVRIPTPQSRAVRVVDAQGQPLAGLRLAIMASGEPWTQAMIDDWQPDVRWATTSDGGDATLAVVPGERWVVLAAHAGHFLYADPERQRESARGPRQRQRAPGQGAPNQGAPSSPEVLQLEPLLAAQVRDAAGRPVAGVLGAMGWPLFPVVYTISDEQGQLLVPIQREDPEHATTLVTRDGFFRVPIELHGQGEQEQRILRLPPLVQLSGRVRDAVSRAPLVGAWVVAAEWDRFVTTDGQGGFTLAVPTPATSGTLVKAAAPGYLESGVIVGGGGQLPGEPIALALQPHMALAGRVVDAQGKGIAAAELVMEVDEFGLGRRGAPVAEPAALRPIRATSGPQGGFRLQPLTPGTPYQLTVQRSGYATHELDIPPLEPGREPEKLVITLERGAAALGRVVDPDEQPVAGAQVELVPHEQRSLSFPRRFRQVDRSLATTDAAGNFALADLQPGRYQAMVRAPGFPEDAAGNFELVAGESTDCGTLQLRRGHSLTGRVTDPAGEPLAGVEVKVMPMSGLRARSATRREQRQEATTDADGQFSFTGLGPSVSLNAARKGYESVSLFQVATGNEEPLEIVLKPGALLRGQVVDEQGRGVAQAEVITSWKGGEGRGMGHVAPELTDERGRFAVGGGVPAQVSLVARHESGISDRLELAVTAVGERQGLRLVLRPAAVMRGRLLDPEGVPVASGQLTLEPAGERNYELVQTTSSSGDGRFTFSQLGSGSYWLVAEHADFAVVRQEVELEGGSEREVELRFRERVDRERLRVSGRVLDEAGNGVLGAEVGLLAANTREGLQALHLARVLTTSLNAGNFELVAPEEGVYRLLVEHPDFAPGHSEDFAVGDRKAPEQIVQLNRGSSIFGLVRGLDPTELQQITVRAIGPNGMREGFVEADGHYQIANLSAGEWTILAQAPDGRRAQGEATLKSQGDEARVDLEFKGNSQIFGRVLQQGAPLPGAAVEVRCGSARAGASTREDGGFGPLEVPEGMCLLQVSDPRSGVSTQRLLQVGQGEVPLGKFDPAQQVLFLEPGQEVVIELDSAVLAGQVLIAESRQPVSGAQVELMFQTLPRGLTPPSSVQTDAQGRFQLPVTLGGTQHLRVVAPGLAPHQQLIDLSSPPPPLEILLAPESPLWLQVRTASGQVPYHLLLQATRIDATVSEAAPYVEFLVPDAGGQAVVKSLPPGRWRLVLRSNEGQADVEVTVPGAAEVILGTTP